MIKWWLNIHILNFCENNNGDHFETIVHQDSDPYEYFDTLFVCMRVPIKFLDKNEKKLLFLLTLYATICFKILQLS